MKQVFIYTRKFFRTQKRDCVVSIIIGVIISSLVVWITGDDMFTTYESTKSGFFSIVSACIWTGIFNSIQLICREKRDIVKDELDKGLSAASYIASHFVFQFMLCFAQSIIILVIYWNRIDFPKDGLIFSSSMPEYLITIFLLLYTADALALIISSIVSTSVVAMTIMPLILILQLVMSGVLFELSDAADKVANITISKWGMAAMGSIGNLNNTELPLKVSILYPEFIFPAREEEEIYAATSEHLGQIWTVLVIFIVCSYILSTLNLKLTTRRLKK